MDAIPNPVEEFADAISTGDAERVRALIAAGADPNTAVWSTGETALYAAVCAGDPAIVRVLLDGGALVAAEAAQDSSSLHAAAEEGNAELVRLLLEADGACALGRFDYVDRTPLHCAVARGDAE